LKWVKDNMLDPVYGLFYFMYRPEKAASKQFDPTMSGLYNAITIIFIDALAPNWAPELYQRFVKHFVKEGSESPHGAGTAVAFERLEPKGGIDELALN
ncbi:hypothetical protein MD537_25295, partial [Flavihumibacter sediminis]|nr:hypothetical protein [Flavihumibacter sediminis]